MPSIDATVTCPVHPSFRVAQVAGMFGLQVAPTSTQQFCVEVPGVEESWEVGLIAGPSGSGKSTVARAAFGDAVYAPGQWASDRAVVDGFGEVPLQQVVRLLTAVGLSSPPTWVRPYQVLSGGEKFRCELARALATSVPGTGESGATGDSGSASRVVVFDEFTSVVDRNVARASSLAVSKAVRSGAVGCRFVAVTCHYDIARWLEADWVLDMARGQLLRRRLRRPPIRLEIDRCPLSAWSLFARHHYLSGSVASSAHCFLARWEGRPVAFAATLPLIARRNHRRFTRIVTLPDFQGMGIGMRMTEEVAQHYCDQGVRMSVTSGHPSLIGHCRRSQRWRLCAIKRFGTSTRGSSFGPLRTSAGRPVVSFRYLPR